MIARALARVGAPSLLAVALSACGGGGGAGTGGSTLPGGTASPDSPERPGGDAARGRTAGAPVTPAEVCDRILALEAGGCAAFAGFDLDRAACIRDFERSLDDRGPEARAATQVFGRCVVDERTCNDVVACVDAMSDQPEELRACDAPDLEGRAVGVSEAAWRVRKGAGMTTFREAASTKDEPIQVCRIAAEKSWLLGLRCDDGSAPFGDSGAAAHAARVGNVGPGGRCGAIIDLYEVPCPEGTYSIYIDAYYCPVPDGQPVPGAP